MGAGARVGGGGDREGVEMSGESLGTELPKAVARVRDKVLPAYLEIGHAGILAVTMMRRDLDNASKAMIEGDVVEMLRAYRSLESWKL